MAAVLDADGWPSAHSIVRKWRAQRLENEERILLQERVFSAEKHPKSRLAAGGVTNQEAESLNQRIKMRAPSAPNW